MPAYETRLKELMLKGLSGDRSSHRTLLAELSRSLRIFFGKRMGRDQADVEDLVQDTLIAIHERRMSYDTAQRFTPWVFAIARYKLVDHYRRHAIRGETESLDELDLVDAFDAAAAADAARDLDQLTRELPLTQRNALYDVKIEGLSVAEAARRRGLSESFIKVSVHRALKRLTARVGGGATDAD